MKPIRDLNDAYLQASSEEKDRIDRLKGQSLRGNKPIDTDQDDIWFHFCIDLEIKVDQTFSDCYSPATNNYHEDYLLCMHRAEEGEPRAVKIKELYLLWRLTQ